MRHVYRRWQEITRRVGEGTVFLFVDYDGTLSPIAARPEAAVLPRRTRGLLKRLAGSPRCRLAVISGRSVADVRRRVGIRGVVYAGNHGFEIEGPQIKFKKPLAPAFIKTMKHLKLELRSRLASLRGARVEDKGFSLSVHYRQVEKRLVPVLKAAFRESTRALCAKSAVEIRGGKMVFEVLPPVDWGKGKVVLWLLTRHTSGREDRRIVPVYVGDDSSDEDAFAALRKKGITVSVGRKNDSAAEYFVNDTREAARFLKRLGDLLEGEGGA